MKKSFISILLMMIAPSICFGWSARYTRLVREKQRKIEELEKCTGKKQDLLIAGLSTIGLTAVGIAGNIAEAKIIKTNDKTIEKQENTIESKEKEYNKRKREKAEAEEAERIRIEEYNRTHTLAQIAEEDINRINRLAGNIGDMAITRGYEPEQLPETLKSRFADAIIGFINKCKGHDNNQKQDSVSITKFGGGWIGMNWETYKTQTYTTLTEDYVIPEGFTEHLILKCLIDKCMNGYSTPDNEQCIEDETDDDGIIPGDDGIIPGGDGNGGNDGTPGDDGNGGDDGTPDENQDAPDCLEEAVKTESNASEAKIIDGVCKITKCKDTTKMPSDDGKKCIVKEGADCLAEAVKKDKNAKTAKIKNGVCTIETCKGSDLEVNPAGKCACPAAKPISPNGQPTKCYAGCDATTLTSLHAETGYMEGNTCKINKCKDNLKTNSSKTACLCNDFVLNIFNALAGEMSNGICIPTECKGNLKLVGKSGGAYVGKICACESGYHPSESDPTECIKTWTREEQQANPTEYCKNHFIDGQTLSESDAQYHCCMEIVNGNATSWNGTQCICKSDMEWKDNKCKKKKPSEVMTRYEEDDYKSICKKHGKEWNWYSSTGAGKCKWFSSKEEADRVCSELEDAGKIKIYTCKHSETYFWCSNLCNG